jgi:hypothetical protein
MVLKSRMNDEVGVRPLVVGILRYPAATGFSGHRVFDETSGERFLSERCRRHVGFPVLAGNSGLDCLF